MMRNRHRHKPGRRFRRHRRLLIAAALLIVILAATLIIGRFREESPTIRITGPEEIVFDWSEESCGSGDSPDLMARAFRDAEGQVQLITANQTNYRKIGPDLDNVRHDCAAIMESDYDEDPAAFNDYEWIGAVYTLDGERIYALVHNEYRGLRHPGQCPSGDYFPCWYAALTLAVSNDGGASYSHAEPPEHLIASSPHPYEPGTGPVGPFSPSNIVYNEEDGYYYVLLRLWQNRDQPGGTCVMRTDDLSDPASWRAWDGSTFSVSFVNPYADAIPDPGEHICQPVARDDIGGMGHSLSFNTELDRFLLIGVTSTPDGRSSEARPGTYFSLSSDLIHWTPRQLVMEHELLGTFECGEDAPLAYPSLLDPNSPTRNFETTSDIAYLYFVRFNYDAACTPTRDRDLIRIPIEISQ